MDKKLIVKIDNKFDIKRLENIKNPEDLLVTKIFIDGYVPTIPLHKFLREVGKYYDKKFI